MTGHDNDRLDFQIPALYSSENEEQSSIWVSLQEYDHGKAMGSLPYSR